MVLDRISWAPLFYTFMDQLDRITHRVFDRYREYENVLVLAEVMGIFKRN